MEFLGTKGQWEVYKPNHVGCINVSIGDCNGFNGYVELWHHHYENKEVAKANAELISEAGNIRQQIPFSLTELKNQRDKMLEMLQELVSANAMHEGYHEKKLKAIQLIKESTELK